MYLLSLAFASTKTASIVAHLVPTMLFLLNVVLRREKFSRTKVCVAVGKVVGSVVLPIASAILQVFIDDGSLTVAASPNTKWFPITSTKLAAVVGFILSVLGSGTSAAWLTNFAQEKMVSEELRYSFILGALMNFFGTLAATIYAVCRYHDKEYYNLQMNTPLGISTFVIAIISAVTSIGARWCEKLEGTPYVAAFSNLSLILDTVAAPFLLKGARGNDKLISYILSFASASLNIIGALIFNWAKKKEAAASETADVESQVQEAATFETAEDEPHDRSRQGENSTAVTPPADHEMTRNTDYEIEMGMLENHNLGLIEGSDDHHHGNEGINTDHEMTRNTDHEIEMGMLENRNLGVEGSNDHEMACSTDHEIETSMLENHSLGSVEGSDDHHHGNEGINTDHEMTRNTDHEIEMIMLENRNLGVEGSADHRHGNEGITDHEMTRNTDHPIEMGMLENHNLGVEGADDHRLGNEGIADHEMTRNTDHLIEMGMFENHNYLGRKGSDDDHHHGNEGITDHEMMGNDHQIDMGMLGNHNLGIEDFDDDHHGNEGITDHDRDRFERATDDHPETELSITALVSMVKHFITYFHDLLANSFTDP